MKFLKGWAAWVIVIATLGLLVFGAFLAFSNLSKPRTTISIGGTAIHAALARTDAEQKQGLGGVTDLPKGQGMLFVFDNDGSQAMWMKDMQIPLDIIWLNADKRVTHIVRDLSPDTYPKSYGSPMPARYVLEVPAGTAAESSITVGTQASFDLD